MAGSIGKLQPSNVLNVEYLIKLKQMFRMIFISASTSPPPTTVPPAPKGCSIDPNSGTDMPEYPPFITDAHDRLVVANGTDDDRAIPVKKGESVFLSCPKENFLNHPSDETLEIR